MEIPNEEAGEAHLYLYVPHRITLYTLLFPILF